MMAGRRVTAALLVLALAGLAAWAVAGLPHFGASRGPYERRFAIEAVRSRQATNLDAFVNFDYRGFDSLGEEYIFLVAIAGFSLLLAERRGKTSGAPRPPVPSRAAMAPDPAVRVFALVFSPVCILFGSYMVVHGQLTPGGGFQGGVAIATGTLALWFGSGYERYMRILPKTPVEAFETLGALGYVGLGAFALLSGGAFMQNVLPLGKAGALFSSGTIDVLNILVGMAISGGFIVLFAEFLKETRLPSDDPE
jgi:multicomponent Na+:H+ antiporter subunit B